MTRLTVHDGFRAVVRVDGRTTDVLEPGRHRLPVSARRRQVDLVDVRERVLVVTGQEVASADAPGVRVSAAMRWRVSDPVAWLDRAADPLEQVRLAVQVALRDWAASAELVALVAGRAAARAVLTPPVAAEGRRVGVAVDEVGVRDVLVPAELRRSMLDAAAARLQGQAALERARGETAALRALANGARLLEEHPALLQLRTVETVARTGGQVVLRVAGAEEPGGAPS